MPVIHLKMKKSFTLIELIVVIVILGIMASFAMPAFIKTKETALGREARANLSLIAAAEKVYRIEAINYYPYSGIETTINNINSALKLYLNETNWDYAITGTDGTTFNATAARNGAGGYLDCSYSIAQNDADGEPNPTNCP